MPQLPCPACNGAELLDNQCAVCIMAPWSEPVRWLTAGKSDALLEKPACPLPEATASERPQWRISTRCTETLCKAPRLMGDFYFCPESRLIYFEIAGE